MKPPQLNLSSQSALSSSAATKSKRDKKRKTRDQEQKNNGSESDSGAETTDLEFDGNESIFKLIGKFPKLRNSTHTT